MTPTPQPAVRVSKECERLGVGGENGARGRGVPPKVARIFPIAVPHLVVREKIEKFLGTIV